LKGLEDESDFVAAEAREGAIVEAGSGLAVDVDGAGSREVHGAS